MTADAADAADELLLRCLTGAGPGELFIVRNVGAFVPPYDGSRRLRGRAGRSCSTKDLAQARRRGLIAVQRRVESGHLTLQGWHYVIEAGEVHVFDARQGGFVPASIASRSGTGPYQSYVEHDGQIISD